MPRLIPARRLATIVAFCAAWCLSAVLPAAAEGWKPARAQRLDIQLLPPFDFARRVDVLALDLFQTPPDQVRQLEPRGIATLCRLSVGVWESWRPDAFAFPQAALGRNRPGRPGERWLDTGHAAVAPLLERRLDLCRERGFKGVLLAGLEADPQAAGATPEQRLAFDQRLAAAGRARGLAVGLMGEPAQVAARASVFDFVVVADCVAAMAGCIDTVRAWHAAGKPAWLVAYTNAASRMTALCAEAARAGAPLLFKTQTLTGKLHRRCSA
jgi:hypothetical protein